MARLHYFVHGRGRGHATRTATIVRALVARGHEVRAFAGASAVDMLSPHVATSPVESLPPRLGVASAVLLMRRVSSDVAQLRRHRVDLVLSDGDLPGLLASRLAGLPSIAIGHGLVFGCCRRPRRLERWPWWREAIKAEISTLGATTKVAVNFVPLEMRGRDSVLARPALDGGLERRGHEGPIVCYFRDGARQVVETLVERGEHPVLFAARNPGIHGVTWHTAERSAFLEALSVARAVVASAGSQLISECVELGIPLYALHHRRDDEQRLNVAMLRASGLGDGTSFEAFDIDALERFLTRERVDGPLDWDAPTAADAVARACELLVSESLEPYDA